MSEWGRKKEGVEEWKRNKESWRRMKEKDKRMSENKGEKKKAVVDRSMLWSIKTGQTENARVFFNS